MNITLSQKDIQWLQEKIKEAEEKDMLLDYETFELVDKPMRKMSPSQRDIYAQQLDNKLKRQCYADTSDRTALDWQGKE